MIGIAEDDLGFYVVFQLPRMHAFDRSERTNGHENRRFYRPVFGFDAPRTGFWLRVGVL